VRREEGGIDELLLDDLRVRPLEVHDGGIGRDLPRVVVGARGEQQERQYRQDESFV